MPDKEPVPDVSDIDIDLQVRRFEQDLFSLDTSRIDTGLNQLDQKYQEFAEIFFTGIVPARNPRIAPEGPGSYIKGFITHPEVRKLYDTCSTMFEDFKPFEKDFAQALRFLKFYFPEKSVPTITTFISEYTYGAFIFGQNDLAVGLDFFLGERYPYQRYNPQNPNFSAYLTRSFNKDHLVAKTLQPLVEELVGQPSGERLLDFMINNGKKLYLLNHLIPEKPDSVLLEMTPGQVKWLGGNERDMWAFFLQEDLLYSSDWQKIRKYVEYSPNSPGMPDEAPGRTANWLGWQIVKAYMKRHPETKMHQLLELGDAQELLNQSRYKPRRR